MKTIMSALAASLLFAGIAAPAHADSLKSLLGGLVKVEGSDKGDKGDKGKTMKLPKELEKLLGNGDFLKQLERGLRDVRR